MSLISALNTAQSALAAHQAAITVTSNNISNAGNPDYTRQVAQLSPLPDRPVSGTILAGSGVTLSSVQRQIDDALEGRIRSSTSDSQAADTLQNQLSQVENVFNALGDNDLSSQMATFFKGWSDLANTPQDAGLRQVVVQNGQSLANSFQSIQSQIGGVQNGIDGNLKSVVRDANSLASQIADLNERISTAEGAGGGQASSLRNQRDVALKSLAQLMDIKTQDTGNGMVNVMAGSEPIVLANTSRGLALTTLSDGTPAVSTVQSPTTLLVNSGQIGGLLSSRSDITAMAGQVDSLASGLIYELNKIHSSGQGLEGFTTTTATNSVNDSSAALNSPAAGLAFPPTNGSFVVHVTQKGTGLVTSTLVQVDLDGLNANDTTLDSLKTTLGGIAGISASISGGKLTIESNSADQEISFSQDSSGVLASLGINSFFTGTNASNIAVNSAVTADPSLLAAAQNGEPGDNQTALSIAALESQSLKSLNGQTLKDNYATMVNALAVKVSSAKTNSTAASNVLDTLSSQREALSGVSMDEEAVNLIREQRAYQGAARVISAIDDMMKTLLAIQ